MKEVPHSVPKSNEPHSTGRRTSNLPSSSSACSFDVDFVGGGDGEEDVDDDDGDDGRGADDDGSDDGGF